MTIKIDVDDAKEGELIREGLADPEVRAFVKIVAALKRLPSDRARQRVFQFAWDHFDEAANGRA